MNRKNSKKSNNKHELRSPKHHRHSIRFKGYDYSQAGLYFVTICTQNHHNLFGKIENKKMKLNGGKGNIVMESQSPYAQKIWMV